MPENWNARVVTRIPSAQNTHTQHPEFMQTLLTQGYATVTMNHPSPGHPGFALDEFIDPPFHLREFGTSYRAAGHLTRDLITAVFGPPRADYAIGYSRGALLGVGLLFADQGSPFDGIAVGAGGEALARFYLYRDVWKDQENGQLLPLTRLPNTVTGLTRCQFENFMAGPSMLGLYDPEYAGLIRASWLVDLGGGVLGCDERRPPPSGAVSALDYDAATRPIRVQQAWEALAFRPEINVKTIVFHGLMDKGLGPDPSTPEGPPRYTGSFPPDLAVAYIQRIIDAGREALLRVYFFRDIAHSTTPGQDTPGFPQATSADVINKLDAWVLGGLEPGPLDADDFGMQPSCNAIVDDEHPAPLGYGGDPLGCFTAVWTAPYPQPTSAVPLAFPMQVPPRRQKHTREV